MGRRKAERVWYLSLPKFVAVTAEMRNYQYLAFKILPAEKIIMEGVVRVGDSKASSTSNTT